MVFEPASLKTMPQRTNSATEPAPKIKVAAKRSGPDWAQARGSTAKRASPATARTTAMVMKRFPSKIPFRPHGDIDRATINVMVQSVAAAAQGNREPDCTVDPMRLVTVETMSTDTNRSSPKPPKVRSIEYAADFLALPAPLRNIAFSFSYRVPILPTETGEFHGKWHHRQFLSMDSRPRTATMRRVRPTVCRADGNITVR